MRRGAAELPGREGRRRHRGLRHAAGRARALLGAIGPQADNAFVALLLIHLHFPDAGSLKSKRKHLASAKAQLRTRLGVSVSEVEGQDTWQRATLAVALTAGSEQGVRDHADRVERFVVERFPDGSRIERTVRSFNEVDE